MTAPTTVRPPDPALVAELTVAHVTDWTDRYRVNWGENPSSTELAARELAAREAVEQIIIAAQLLDVRRPGWFRRIDLGRLCMVSLYDCVLGQLFGDFSTGLHAFVYRESNAVYPLLLRAFQGDAPPVAWRREVERRLQLAEDAL